MECKTTISELQNSIELKEQELRNLQSNLEGKGEEGSAEEKQNELIMQVSSLTAEMHSLK